MLARPISNHAPARIEANIENYLLDEEFDVFDISLLRKDPDIDMPWNDIELEV